MNHRARYIVPLPGGRSLALGGRTLVMGILNVTPDSFADGGLHVSADAAVAHGRAMIAAGADIIDVGGESTRPGAEPVDADEERRRVLPVVEQLAASGVVVSIDTTKAVVAREAIARGAAIVNDISGLQFEPALGRVVADGGAALVLMHTRGRPAGMAERAEYGNVVDEVAAELREALARAAEAGVPADAVILDPGIGFAKRPAHSYAAMAGLAALAALGRPILCGPSRKSFLTEALGTREPAGRDWGTAAAVAASVLLGAHIVRVHAVAAMMDVVRVADRIRAASGEE